MMNTFYSIPFKKTNLEPHRKSDILIGYEVSENRKLPKSAVFLGKKKVSEEDNEEEESFKTEDDKTKFIPVPIIKKDELNPVCFYIAGVSGSGKSYYTAQLVNTILMQPRFQDAEVYLITGQTKPDKAYEENIEKYLKLNLDADEFYSLTHSDFEDCIVIFDDTTSLGNPAREKFIFNLQKSLVENARKSNVALINISHQSRDFTKTKYIIHESNYYVLFPSASWNDASKFLKSYLDFDSDQLKDIKKMSRHTRAITIHKSNPQFIIADHIFKMI